MAESNKQRERSFNKGVLFMMTYVDNIGLFVPEIAYQTPDPSSLIIRLSFVFLTWSPMVARRDHY